MIAAEIAHQLGHAQRRGRKWRCDCPLHGGHSLELCDGEIAPLVKCWGGCGTVDVLRELRRLGLLDDRRDQVVSGTSISREQRVAEDAERINLARSFWRGSSALIGSLAESFLASRGLNNVGANPSLRFLPTHGFSWGVIAPAMIAALVSPERAITAVQLTALSPNGLSKADMPSPRRTYGVLGRGAVRLAPAGEVLGVAEGTETALAAMTMLGVPVWAALGGNRMASIAIPAGVRELHIFADDDEPGRVAAERAAAAHPNLRTVIRLPPGGCKDFNDALIMQMAST
jgi:putative DNA primase/helicase